LGVGRCKEEGTRGQVFPARTGAIRSDPPLAVWSGED